MKKRTIDRINAFFEKHPLAHGTPASEAEIREAEEILQLTFDADYVSFQRMYGGSVLGSREVCGLSNSELMGDANIIELTESYRIDECGDPNWLTIGTDYSGNSIGLGPAGQVVAFDHDLGDFAESARSFEEYVLKALEEVEPRLQPGG